MMPISLLPKLPKLLVSPSMVVPALVKMPLPRMRSASTSESVPEPVKVTLPVQNEMAKLPVALSTMWVLFVIVPESFVTLGLLNCTVPRPMNCVPSVIVKSLPNWRIAPRGRGDAGKCAAAGERKSPRLGGHRAGVVERDVEGHFLVVAWAVRVPELLKTEPSPLKASPSRPGHSCRFVDRGVVHRKKSGLRARPRDIQGAGKDRSTANWRDFKGEGFGQDKGATAHEELVNGHSCHDVLGEGPVGELHVVIRALVAIVRHSAQGSSSQDRSSCPSRRSGETVEIIGVGVAKEGVGVAGVTWWE